MGVPSFGPGTQTGSSRNQGNGTHGELKLRRIEAQAGWCRPSTIQRSGRERQFAFVLGQTLGVGFRRGGPSPWTRQLPSAEAHKVLRWERSAGSRVRPGYDGTPEHPQLCVYICWACSPFYRLLKISWLAIVQTASAKRISTSTHSLLKVSLCLIFLSYRCHSSHLWQSLSVASGQVVNVGDVLEPLLTLGLSTFKYSPVCISRCMKPQIFAS